MSKTVENEVIYIMDGIRENLLSFYLNLEDKLGLLWNMSVVALESLNYLLGSILTENGWI